MNHVTQILIQLTFKKWLWFIVPTLSGLNFCGISIRFLNEELQLYAFILGCYIYDWDSQNANQIRQFVNGKLKEYKLSLDSDKFVVTDNENKLIWSLASKMHASESVAQFIIWTNN